MLIRGDARCLPVREACVDCVVTSPPYFGLRDYGMPGQIGLEPSLEGYVSALVGVFREHRRVLKPRGTVWCNVGDSYATNVHTSSYGKNAEWYSLNSIAGKRIPDGTKPKDLLMI